MNFFLLLKNELSLTFLRSTENVAQALKSAIRIYASRDEGTRRAEEASELHILEKILNSMPVDQEDDP
jgi:hypothetical protein